MGLKAADQLCAGLIHHGRAPETPVAVVGRAAQPEQRVITGTLTTLPAVLENESVPTPALVIVGDVVNCRPSLDWLGPPQDAPRVTKIAS
jgi:uroporphyrin-III C-methyltransferase/precorrin-2 dehydrogenase/sirohydrochlorin ferrochelatase